MMEIPKREIIASVYRYAIDALQDSLHDFEQDVMGNDGWSQDEAATGLAMLKKLIESLECHIAIAES
jgi:hypothetical protein